MLNFGQELGPIVSRVLTLGNGRPIYEQGPDQNTHNRRVPSLCVHEDSHGVNFNQSIKVCLFSTNEATEYKVTYYKTS